MDSLFKLRVLIWILVLGLWAHLTYQFLVEEEPPAAQMRSIANPFPQQPLPAPFLIPSSKGTSATQSVPNPIAPANSMATAAPFGNFIKPLPVNTPPSTRPQTLPRPVPVGQSIRRHEFGPMEEQPAPAGFVETDTRHFIVYSEGAAPSPAFVQTMENLHGNLMLDLAAFSPWANDDKVFIYLFRNQATYHQVTGRPAWSGGASSISKRKIYLYESDETIGIMAHEMCHIYFDGYFLGGASDPLWLSEGLATLIQVERGLATPNWLPENLETLRHGGGFRLYDLMRVTSTAGANDDNVRLWYTQSYSIVRFLLRLQGHAAFYHFCTYLRSGEPLRVALYHAYGMPYNRIQALEYAWRYNLKTHRLSRLHSAP